jgi:hypothetical protein
VDEFGDSRVVPKKEVARLREGVLEPFVSRNLMLGKAMVIFWPVYPHFRWNILR